MWWSGRAPAWTRGSKPENEIPEPTYEGEGLKGATFAAAGVALANLLSVLTPPTEARP